MKGAYWHLQFIWVAFSNHTQAQIEWYFGIELNRNEARLQKQSSCGELMHRWLFHFTRLFYFLVKAVLSSL